MLYQQMTAYNPLSSLKQSIPFNPLQQKEVRQNQLVLAEVESQQQKQLWSTSNWINEIFPMSWHFWVSFGQVKGLSGLLMGVFLPLPEDQQRAPISGRLTNIKIIISKKIVPDSGSLALSSFRLADAWQDGEWYGRVSLWLSGTGERWWMVKRGYFL